MGQNFTSVISGKKPGTFYITLLTLAGPGMQRFFFGCPDQSEVNVRHQQPAHLLKADIFAPGVVQQLVFENIP